MPDAGMRVDNNTTGLYNEPVKVDHYVQRQNARKSFALRDAVVYDKGQKEGTIITLDSRGVSILRKDTEIIDTRDGYDVHKKDEFTTLGHWDHLPDAARYTLLAKAHLSDAYVKSDWSGIPRELKPLLKDESMNVSPSSGKPDTSYSQSGNHGISQRGFNSGKKTDERKPGNDTITTSEPSPVEHNIDTKVKQKDG